METPPNQPKDYSHLPAEVAGAYLAQDEAFRQYYDAAQAPDESDHDFLERKVKLHDLASAACAIMLEIEIKYAPQLDALFAGHTHAASSGADTGEPGSF